MNKTAKKLQKSGFRLVTMSVENGEKVFYMTRSHSRECRYDAEVRGETINGLTLKDFLDTL